MAAISTMGFPRDRVEEALKVSNNDPDMALDYLEGGAESVEQQFVC